MSGRSFRRTLRAAFAAAALGLVAGIAGLAIGAELSSDNIRETSRSGGTAVLGLRPTGVGMPEVGAHGTLGAGEYGDALRAYHDSGQYGDDLEAVGKRARAYLKRRVSFLRREARRRCARAERRGAPPKRVEAACAKPQPALVLDIDETSLSNYDELASAGFENALGALVLAAAQADSPAIDPTLQLYGLAVQKKVAVFFITGRPEDIPQAREVTEQNLRAEGYTEWERLILNDTGEATIPYKSGKRAGVEEEGWDIVLNVGDQESDLAGGHADRAFKLPNPFYFIG